MSVTTLKPVAKIFISCFILSMNISKTDKLSFGAKFINNTTVKKLTPKTNAYLNKKVSFVEIEPKNHNDINVLGNIAKYWGSNGYACNIAYDAYMMSLENKLYNKNRVFAITSQNKNYNNLNDRNILGILEISEESPKEVFIHYVQTNPQYIYALSPKEYKYIGTRILESLRNLYGQSDFILQSATNDFYELLGFICTNSEKNEYRLPAGKAINTSFII